MKTILVTGGAGFFGELLKKYLLGNNYYCGALSLQNDHRRLYI